MRFLLEDKVFQVSDDDYKKVTKILKDQKIKYKDIPNTQINKPTNINTTTTNTVPSQGSNSSTTSARAELARLELKNANAKLFKQVHKYYNKLREENENLPKDVSDNGFAYINALVNSDVDKGLVTFLRNSNDIPEKLGKGSTDIIIKLITNGMLTGSEKWLYNHSLMTSEDDTNTAFKIKCMTMATSDAAQAAFYDEGEKGMEADKFCVKDESGKAVGYMNANEMRAVLDKKERSTNTTPRTGYQIINHELGKENINKKPSTDEINSYLANQLHYFKDDLLDGKYNDSLSDILSKRYTGQGNSKEKRYNNKVKTFLDAVQARLTGRKRDAEYRDSNSKNDENTIPKDPSKSDNLETTSQKLANQDTKVDY